MAKRVIWAEKAIEQRREILEYWANRNKSKTYSRKLSSLFRVSVKSIQSNPKLGKPTNLEGVRARILRSFLIVYEENEHEIVILTIWDTRRDPKSFPG